MTKQHNLQSLSMIM